MTAQIVNRLGARIGDANRLYENDQIRETILKPMIESEGGDSHGQDPLPPLDCYPPYDDLSERVCGILGLAGWAYKDAKLCLVWRAWAQSFPNAKWVLVRRDVRDIALSCIRTGFMKAFSTQRDWMIWALEYVARMEDMKKNLNFIEVWPDKAINGDASDYRAMADFCRLAWDDSVMDLVNSHRWRA